jgi:hypothetical protein
MLTTFDGPRGLCPCAQAICGVLRSLGIEVRAGIHTGKIGLRGTDIGGIAVHIGQRVSALAGPGEVLVSSVGSLDVQILWCDCHRFFLLGIACEDLPVFSDQPRDSWLRTPLIRSAARSAMP